MRIRFLGTGAAFTLDNFHSNMVIEEQGKKLLIDAGGDIRFSLKHVGLSYKDIDCILETPDSCRDLNLIRTKYMDLETIDTYKND